MLNPEDFRRQLDQALQEELKRREDKKNQIAEERRAAETIALSEARLREKEKELEKKGEQNKEFLENSAVLEIVKQAQIVQRLEGLRQKVAPKQKIKKFGPEKGEVGYSLVCGAGLRRVRVGESSTYNSGSYQRHVGVTGEGWTTSDQFGLRIVRSVFGLKINHEGQVLIFSRECARARGYEKEINPLLWERRYKYEYGWDQDESYRLNYMIYGRLPQCNAPLPRYGVTKKTEIEVPVEINIASEEGVQQFTQALTDFYVGLKTGQGK